MKLSVHTSSTFNSPEYFSDILDTLHVFSSIELIVCHKNDAIAKTWADKNSIPVQAVEDPLLVSSNELAIFITYEEEIPPRSSVWPSMTHYCDFSKSPRSNKMPTRPTLFEEIL